MTLTDSICKIWMLTFLMWLFGYLLKWGRCGLFWDELIGDSTPCGGCRQLTKGAKLQGVALVKIISRDDDILRSLFIFRTFVSSFVKNLEDKIWCNKCGTFLAFKSISNNWCKLTIFFSYIDKINCVIASCLKWSTNLIILNFVVHYENILKILYFN